MIHRNLKSKRMNFALLACLFLFSTTFSAPHWGTITELEQPDGSVIKALMYGDEFYGWFETPDGYTIIKDPKTGWFCYAVLSENEELVSSSIKYLGEDLKSNSSKKQQLTDSKIVKKIRPSAKKQKELRKNKMMELNMGSDNKQMAPMNRSSDLLMNNPLTSPDDIYTTRIGSFTGITLLIDFSDDTATMSISDIDNFLNDDSGYTGYGNNGSVREYFSDISGGLLDYTNYLPPFYYRAKHPKTYYTDPAITYGYRARELITEALNHVDSIGFDFSTLSHDGSKRIYAINCLYAGGNGGVWSVGLWPHSWTLHPVFEADSVRSFTYQITNIGSSLSIGTFCHENGHMLLDYPDLYDYGYESNGTGSYCLMSSSGSKNPIPPCPYLRDLSGWMTITDITFMPNDTLLTHTANSNTAYRYLNAENTPANEYFLVNAILPVGRYATLVDSGLAIWHIDRFGDNDDEQMTCGQHYIVSMEQADGNFDLENGNNHQDANDLFDAIGNNEFSDVTTVNSQWWCNTIDGNNDSHLRIWDISAPGTTMTFRCSGASDDIVVTHPAIINALSTAQTIDVETSYEDLVVNLNGTGIDESQITNVDGLTSFSVIANIPDDTIWVTVTGKGFRYRGFIFVDSYTEPDTVNQVMGFEDPGLWHFILGSNGTLTGNGDHTTEGAGSMQIGGNGYQQFQSVNLNTDQIIPTSSNLKLDIFVGSTQPNPDWVGQVQLYINCPSAGINDQFIGSADLTGLPLDSFSTVSFNLPSNIMDALTGSHQDFSFSFSLNTNAGSGSYYFDNLRF